MREGSKKEVDFEVIFRENYSRLYYHAMSFLNDHESARDVVNDVFEQLWTCYDRLKFTTSITPLLYTFVRNGCINHLRRQRARERFSADVLWTSEEAMEDDNSEYEELLGKLRCAIEQLPEQTKVVFKKCFLDGKKYQDAADELEISINTVKTHVKKALRLLRGEFTEDQLVLYFFFHKNFKKTSLDSR